MRWFWPCFFAFLTAVVLLVAVARPGAFDAALWYIGVYLAIVAGTITLMGVVTAAIVVYGLYTRYKLAGRRQKDGAFPLQQHRLRTGATLTVDPNRIVPASYIIDRDRGLIELDPAAGYPAQLQYNVAVQATRSVQAIFKGDDAHSNSHGAHSDNPRLTAATKPLFSPKLPEPAPAPPSGPPVQPTAMLTLKRAFQQSAPDRLILGQATDGALAIYNPRLHASCAIVGNTGTGKTTSAGFTLAAQAAKNGYHLIILDPDGGHDWAPFAAHAEWTETDRATFPAHIARIHGEFEDRAELAEQQPILVIIEEYGDLSRQLRIANPSAAKEVDAMLDTMMGRGRKRSMAFVLIDQYPEHWTNPVLSAVKFRVVYQLGPSQGAKFEEYKASSLPPRGVFLVDHKPYTAWDAKPHLRPMLAALPAAPSPILPTVRGERSRPRSQPRSPEVAHPPPPPANAPMNEPETAPPAPVEDTVSQWQPLVDAWFSEHPYALSGPPAGISDIARRMSLAATGSEDSYENYKSLAHRMYHDFRAAAQLPATEHRKQPAPLGTDPTRIITL